MLRRASNGGGGRVVLLSGPAPPRTPTRRRVASSDGDENQRDVVRWCERAMKRTLMPYQGRLAVLLQTRPRSHVGAGSMWLTATWYSASRRHAAIKKKQPFASRPDGTVPPTREQIDRPRSRLYSVVTNPALVQASFRTWPTHHLSEQFSLWGAGVQESKNPG